FPSWPRPFPFPCVGAHAGCGNPAACDRKIILNRRERRMEQEICASRGRRDRPGVGTGGGARAGHRPDRAALRLLRRLAASGARLTPDDSGGGIVGTAEEAQAAGAAVVRALRSAGLVEDDRAGGLTLSKAGLAALRRALSGGDFAAQHQERAV